MVVARVVGGDAVIAVHDVLVAPTAIQAPRTPHMGRQVCVHGPRVDAQLHVCVGGAHLVQSAAGGGSSSGRRQPWHIERTALSLV